MLLKKFWEVVVENIISGKAIAQRVLRNRITISSRKLRQEFTEHLEKIYNKNVFWNGSYFVASCGGVTVSTLRKYIEGQNQPED